MQNNKDSKKKTILLVEDNKFISKVYLRGFSDAGFEVFHIEDGQNAISAIKKIKPDIILLDLIMPKRDGFEVLEDIELNPDLKKIPIIILSNLEDDFYKKDLEKYKAAGNMLKSNHTIQEVVDKINSILNK